MPTTFRAPLHPGNRVVSWPRRLGLFVLTFFITIPMQVNVAGKPVGVALALMLAMSLWYVADALLRSRRSRDEIHFLLLVLALLVYFLFVSIVGGVRDTAVVTMCVYAMIIFTATIVLARAYWRAFGDEFVTAGLKSLFAVGLLHSFVQIAVLVVEPFARAVYGLVFLSETSSIHISQGYRSPGLFSSGAAILATFNALMLTVGLVLFLRRDVRPGVLRTLAMAVAVLVQLLAVAISGRTGFAVLLLALVVLAVHKLAAGEGTEATRRMTALGLASAGLIAAGMVYVGLENIENNLRWSFEFVYSWLESGSVSTESTSVLFGDMFFLPDTLLGTIFGTSNFGRGPNFSYIDSDVGYILMIHGGGIVGLIVMMSVYGYLLAHARSVPRGELALLMTCFVAAIFLVNIKDFYFLQNDGVTQIILFCHELLIVQRRHAAAARPHPKAAYAHA
jgi:hypothetical protein